MRHFVLTILVGLLVGVPASSQDESKIVFVCEHGAAKSVIAAAYFNKIAAEQKLHIRALARGTNPQSEMSGTVTAGLRGDNVPFDLQKPILLTNNDAIGAVRIVAFTNLPESYAKSVRVD